MKPILGSLSAAGLGALTLSLVVAGCGGGIRSFTPSAEPNGVPMGLGQNSAGIVNPDHKSCSLVRNTQDFTDKNIKINNWIWFTSVFKIPKGAGAVRVKMTDSVVQFSSKKRSFTVRTPDMFVTLRSYKTVKLGYDNRGGWELNAPVEANGKAFMNGVPFKAKYFINKGLKNVTWSARFYSDRSVRLNWKWGAAVYTRFANVAKALAVKPLKDSKYRPFNDDPAGTPENFKDWLVPGGTGSGNGEFIGKLGPEVKVTPCR